MKMVRASFQNICLSIMELFMIRRIAKQVTSRFRITGNEHLEAAFAAGKGIVLVISHLGSWEYLSFLPYMTQRAWSVIVKKIKNLYVNKTVDHLRRSTSLQPLLKSGSIRKVLQELHANHGVAVLIDQWAGDEGLWLEFFNHETSTTSIPARLAKQTGCALIPAYCLRRPDGRYEILIEEPLPWDSKQEDWEAQITGRLNRILEKKIREYPEQWCWTHRRWKSKPIDLRGTAVPGKKTKTTPSSNSTNQRRSE